MQDTMEDAERVREILGVALGKTIEQGATVRRDTEEAWDSVKHVELVFLLEDEFGIEFDEETMAELDSIEAIVAAINRARG